MSGDVGDVECGPRKAHASTPRTTAQARRKSQRLAPTAVSAKRTAAVKHELPRSDSTRRRSRPSDPTPSAADKRHRPRRNRRRPGIRKTAGSDAQAHIRVVSDRYAPSYASLRSAQSGDISVTWLAPFPDHRHAITIVIAMTTCHEQCALRVDKFFSRSPV